MIPLPILAALLAQSAFAPLPPAAAVAAPPVADWPGLPRYPLPRDASIEQSVAFVRDEVETGRCRPLTSPGDTAQLRLPVAILVGPGGQVRQITPRAIGCPSVEQYVVGYLLSLTRTDMVAAPSGDSRWYQLTVDYRW